MNFTFRVGVWMFRALLPRCDPRPAPESSRPSNPNRLDSSLDVGVSDTKEFDFSGCPTSSGVGGIRPLLSTRPPDPPIEPKRRWRSPISGIWRDRSWIPSIRGTPKHGQICRDRGGAVLVCQMGGPVMVLTLHIFTPPRLGECRLRPWTRPHGARSGAG